MEGLEVDLHPDVEELELPIFVDEGAPRSVEGEMVYGLRFFEEFVEF